MNRDKDSAWPRICSILRNHPSSCWRKWRMLWIQRWDKLHTVSVSVMVKCVQILLSIRRHQNVGGYWFFLTANITIHHLLVMLINQAQVKCQYCLTDFWHNIWVFFWTLLKAQVSTLNMCVAILRTLFKFNFIKYSYYKVKNSLAQNTKKFIKKPAAWLLFLRTSSVCLNGDELHKMKSDTGNKMSDQEHLIANQRAALKLCTVAFLSTTNHS